MLSKSYLVILLISTVIILSYKAILIFSTLLLTILFGFFFYLDQQLPEIEKDYEIFKNYDRPIHFLRPESENILSKKYEGYFNKITLVKNFEMNRMITNDENVDEKINDLLQLFFKHYIYVWSNSVTLTNDFSSKLYIFINYTITSFYQRFKRINPSLFISNKVLDCFIKHHRIYRFTKNNFGLSNDKDDFEMQFFQNETKLDGQYCHEILCRNHEKFISFMDQIIDILQYLLYPYSNFNQTTFRSLTKGIFLQTIVLPLFELISSSDFLNKFLINLCKDDLPTPDGFINHLQYAINVEELNAILESIDQEITIVRSKDNHSDEIKMKQQLGSLTYLKKIVSTMINDKFANHDERYRDASLLNNDNNKITISQQQQQYEDNYFDDDPEINSFVVKMMTFDSILNNNIALEYFIDYLLQNNLQTYINFFINVESYKITLEQTYFELYLLGLQQDMNDDHSHNDGENIVQNNIHTMNHDKTIEDKQMYHYKIVREAAMNIFETYISPISTNRLELVEESFCDNVRNNLSSGNPQNWMNETLFDELFDNVRDIIINNPQFLRSFKRDRNSMKLLSQTDFVNEFKSKKHIEKNPTDKKPDVLDNEENKYSLVPGFGAEIIETGILNDHGKPFVAYLIQIDKPNSDKWIILRRYSEFYEFHQFIAIKCQRIRYNLKAVLSLPPKTVLNNRLNPKFIQHRRNQLNLYLKRMYFVYERFPFLRNDIECFLHPNTNYFGPNHTIINQSSNEPNNFLQNQDNTQVNNDSLHTFNPFRVLGNVVKNGSENILDSFQKISRTLSLQTDVKKVSNSQQQQSTIQAPPSPIILHREKDSSLQDQDELSIASSSSKASLLDSFDRKNIESENYEENIPILYVLDELFDLKNHNFWLRRRLIDIFKQIFEVTYSDMINKKIFEYIDDLTSFDAFGKYITMIKDSIWDINRELREPIEPKNEEIFRRRFAARSLILSSFTDLRKVIGAETVQNGLLNFVNLFQNDIINQRFVLVLFELLIKEIFPDNYFDEIFHRLYRSMQKNSLNTRNDTKNSPNKKEWPPHLCKFVAKI